MKLPCWANQYAITWLLLINNIRSDNQNKYKSYRMYISKLLNSALVILNKRTQNCCLGEYNKEGRYTLSSTTKDYWNQYEILIKYLTLVTLLIKAKTTSLFTQILRLVQYLILFLYFVYYEYVGWILYFFSLYFLPGFNWRVYATKR